MKRLYVSAFQSAIFNKVLARRIDSVDRVFVGDVAKKTATGGIFVVEDAETDQQRTDEFEISPTGPLPGYRCELAEGRPGQIERDVLAERGVDPEQLHRTGTLKVKGTRRELRFALSNPRLSAGTDKHGEYIELVFGAPSGCYATVAVDEILKVGNRES